MELKEFIKNVLVEVSEGVILAKETLKETDVLINPNTKGGFVRKDKATERNIQNISFDVSVTVNEEESNRSEDKVEGGAKIQVVSLFYLGIGSSSSNSELNSVKNSSISRISFSIPISLPADNELIKDGIKLRSHGVIPLKPHKAD